MPQNHLFSELRDAYCLNSPLDWRGESARLTYNTSTEFLRYHLLRLWLLSTPTDFINLTFVNNFFFYYFFGSECGLGTRAGEEVYKNPHRPLRKGISNMIRLHATGALALPIEVRLQILASSRDVIHSWAIPAAGIKIDCVPGYTSHKIMTFLLEGIYWGQCMEICGRYHH